MYETTRPPELIQSDAISWGVPDSEEIKHAIKHLARDKATGPDKISAEALQAGGKIAHEMT